jgi:hypothetical protein
MSSAALKHPQAIIDTDQHLRRLAAGGARVQVSAGEVAEALNCTTTTAAGSLQWLVHMGDTGLSSISGGKYEYRTPAIYPHSITKLKASMQDPEKRDKRSFLQSEFLTWFSSLKPGTVFTTHQAHEALGCYSGSVSNAIKKLVKYDVVEHLEGSIYRRPEAPDQSTIVVDNLPQKTELWHNVKAEPWHNSKAGPEPEPNFMPEQVVVKAPTPLQVANAIKKLAPPAEEVEWEELSIDKDGNYILRCGNKVYRAVEL